MFVILHPYFNLGQQLSITQTIYLSYTVNEQISGNRFYYLKSHLIMSNITQRNRLLSISTPLEEDFLLINRLSAREEVSSLFSFEIELLHEEKEPGYEPTVIDPEHLLGQAVAIDINQRDGTTRTLSGIVNHFSQGHRDTRFSYYNATVVPPVWLLTQRSQSRIFQHQSVPDILREVLAGFDVSYELQGSFKPRNYCVQYRETDFDFVSRLMEEEGIYYLFEHTGKENRMIIANTPQSHPDCPSKSDIPFFLKVTEEEEETEDFISSIGKWQNDHRLQSGKISFRDYNFQLPSNKLDANQSSRFKVSNNDKLEVYDFPGGYAKKFDDIDRSGGERPDAQNVFEDKRKRAEVAMQSLDSQYRIITGNSDCCTLTAGNRFKLFNHPNGKQNGQYIVTKITHEAEQSPTYISDDKIRRAYGNSFQCIAYGKSSPPFRPARKTLKPIVQGSQTAFVVGPAGEEIYTDKFGRVKVQFHWDRESQVDVNSSCWIRVAQAWAGNRWGMMFVPHVGMEVIVEFLEGDPDQPIISGCVYNPATMPPYDLPDEKTKMTIKSNSSKGGKGFNELRFEDKKGGEQIFIHGEKDLDVRIKKDSKELVGNDRHLIVEKDKLEKVQGDKHLQVFDDKNEKIGGTVSLRIGQDLQEKVGSNYALDARREIHIKSGMNLVIESGTTLTLKVGGNFININSAGVFIEGARVMINSGAIAGSGIGSSPEIPKDPAEADRAVPGKRVSPLPPKSYSPAALVMKQAAQKGIPFCEICPRE